MSNNPKNDLPIENGNVSPQNSIQPSESLSIIQKEDKPLKLKGACHLLFIPDSPESIVPEAPYGRARAVKYMWCDEETFFIQLKIDIDSAKALIIIQSPYLYANRLEKLEPNIRAAIARGVLVCIFIQKPDDWENRHNERLPQKTKEMLDGLASRIERLRKMGAHVTLLDKVHSKFVVVDESIFWSGSVNSLSHRNTKEDMTRWEADSVTILASLKFRNFQPCEQCQSLRLIFGGNESERRRVLGSLFQARREFIGLSQSAVARLCRMDQGNISKLEKGLLDARFSTVLKFLASIGTVLVPSPWFLASAAEHFILRRYPAWAKWLRKDGKSQNKLKE